MWNWPYHGNYVQNWQNMKYKAYLSRVNYGQLRLTMFNYEQLRLTMFNYEQLRLTIKSNPSTFISRHVTMLNYEINGYV